MSSLIRRSALLTVLFLLLPAGAQAGWPDDPTVNLPVCVRPGTQADPAICPDGSGGVVVAWKDDFYDELRIQRVGAGGELLWDAEGIVLEGSPSPIPPLLMVRGDGDHTFLAWAEHSGLWLCLVDDQGASVWSGGSLNLGDPDLAGDSVAMVPDGVGGVILAWHDERNYPDAYDVYAQRVSAAGQELWTPGGVLVADPGDFQEKPVTLAPRDGGGAFVGWMDASGEYLSLVMQALDGGGNLLWSPHGITLTPETYLMRSFTVPDGAGGVVVAWSDSRSSPSGLHVYAQRMTSGGASLWGAGGLCVSRSGSEWGAGIGSLLSTGDGGAVVAYTESPATVPPPYSEAFLQRVSPAGALLWGASGRMVCDHEGDSSGSCLLASTGTDFIVTWLDDRSTNPGIYAQRFDLQGERGWDEHGVRITAVADYHVATTDGYGGAILAWDEARGSDLDIYAQRVDADGNLGGSAPTPTPTPTEPSLLLELSSDEVTPGDRLLLELTALHPTAAVTVDLYVLLEAYGWYWFWPGWTEAPDRDTRALAAGVPHEAVILDFAWPPASGSGEAAFFGGMFHAGTFDQLGRIQYAPFRWHP